MSWKRFLGMVAGATLGAIAGILGRCSGSACGLTSSPWSGMIVGAILGFLMTPE